MILDFILFVFCVASALPQSRYGFVHEIPTRSFDVNEWNFLLPGDVTYVSLSGRAVNSRLPIRSSVPNNLQNPLLG